MSDVSGLPEYISHEQAAELLKCTPVEIAALLLQRRLRGDAHHVLGRSVRQCVERQIREQLQPPPKQTTVIVWPGPCS